MACSTNLANNRQTRMLADLSVIGCYNSSLSSAERDSLMLESAQRNLQSMPLIMLTEYQKVSQFLYVIILINLLSIRELEKNILLAVLYCTICHLNIIIENMFKNTNPWINIYLEILVDHVCAAFKVFFFSLIRRYILFT